MLSRALAGRCRRLVRANEVGRRRGFFSWLKSGSTEEKKSHILPDGSFLPMIESPYPEVRSLGQSYAQGGVGCGKCKEAKLYSCPQSGIPSHCKKECYDEDKVHQEVRFSAPPLTLPLEHGKMACMHADAIGVTGAPTVWKM
jgi:hypothetical protein